MSFEIGSKVVCIDARFILGTKPPIKEGEIYIVEGIFECSCKSIYLDVGVSSTGTMTCSKCWKRTDNSIWWFRDSRFITMEFNEEVNSLIESIPDMCENIAN